MLKLESDRGEVGEDLNNYIKAAGMIMIIDILVFIDELLCIFESIMRENEPPCNALTGPAGFILAKISGTR